MKRILIIWEGLNVCSLLINELVKSENYLVDLIYTKANVPFKDQKSLFAMASNRNELTVANIDVKMTGGKKKRRSRKRTPKRSSKKRSSRKRSSKKRSSRKRSKRTMRSLVVCK